jgi:hypothetical protein
MRVIVLGYVVRCPLAGMAWHYLNYVLGLRALGHDVYFMEDSDDFASCYDPTRHVTDTDPTSGLDWTQRAFDDLGLPDRWAYHDMHTATWHGPAGERARALCAAADVLINVSGANPLRPWHEGIPTRIFIDTDPVFEQIRQLTEPGRRERTAAHTAHFTFGESLAHGRSEAPDDGWTWRPTRQPVALEAWPPRPGRRGAAVTSVMQWDSYPAREHGGRRFGLKSDAFQPFLDLPACTPETLELALGSESAPRSLLEARGWRLRDPLAVTRTLASYAAYIDASKAEFSVAKHGYVVGRTGWFSERSALYLASARPVLAQETGYSDWIETGEGLLAFTTPDEALAGLAAIDADYARHCRRAREVAEAHFDARDVLARLLEAAHA